MRIIDNPFFNVVKRIGDENKSRIPAYYRLGMVSSVDPLKVTVNGTIQEKEDLLKNADISSFVIGERILLMPIDDEQRYIILCKVVDI